MDSFPKALSEETPGHNCMTDHCLMQSPLRLQEGPDGLLGLITLLQMHVTDERWQSALHPFSSDLRVKCVRETPPHFREVNKSSGAGEAELRS